MSEASDSAEQVMRLYLEGTEFAIKITGSAVKNIATALYTISKEKKTSRGKARLSSMLRTGKELKIFSVKKEDMKIFAREAKAYGVLYCALVSKGKNSIDDMVDIMVRSEDAPKINRIFERFNLTTVNKADIKADIEREELEKKDLEGNTPERELPEEVATEDMVNEILGEPTQKEENVAPLESQTEKSPQLENTLETPKDSISNEGNVKPSEKKSVRKELEKYKLEKKLEKELKEVQIDKGIEVKEGKEISQIPSNKKSKGVKAPKISSKER